MKEKLEPRSPGDNLNGPFVMPMFPIRRTSTIPAPGLRAGIGALLCLGLLAPQSAGALQSGPENGALVIVGGALDDPGIVERFIELAGGPDAKIVVVPTAGGRDDYPSDCCMGLLTRNGARNVQVLHTRDPALADTEAFVEPLLDADGVWFPGGRQWRLADAYLGTRTEQAFHDVLARGGVIGGSSAGASIQADYLVRGDTRGNRTMMGDHLEGFGFITGVGIDQHLLARNRQFDMLEVVEANPGLLGIGLDENTAIVVEGDTFEVMGRGYVAIYDPTAEIDAAGDFYFLEPGDRYDLSTRTSMRGSAGRPVARVRHPGGIR